MHKTKRIIADFVLDGPTGTDQSESLDDIGALRKSPCGTYTISIETPGDYAAYLREMDQIVLQNLNAQLEKLDMQDAARKPATLLERWRRYLSALLFGNR